MTPLEIILFFALIILLGYFIKALVGFGGAMFSVPILVLFFDVTLVVPIASLVNMLSGIILLPSVKKKFDKKELLLVFIGAFFGTIVGVYLLKSVANDTLKIIFGVLVILFALRMIFEKYLSFKKLKSYFATVFGAIGGLTGGMFSTHGPPIALYLGHQIKDKHILRGTLILVFLIISIWRNGLYLFTGMFNTEIYTISAFMIPIIIIASFFGSKVHLKISQEVYRKIVVGILLVSGILLVVG